MIDYEGLLRALKELATALEPIILAIRESWETIKPLTVLHEEYYRKKKHIEHMRSSWVVPKDTRVKNQVLINKPKFIVRKVIR